MPGCTFKDKNLASEAGKKHIPAKKHNKTLQWEALGEYLIGPGAERALSIMMEMPDDKFMSVLKDLLEYFKPRQQRTEVKAEISLEHIEAIRAAFEEVTTDEEI